MSNDVEQLGTNKYPEIEWSLAWDFNNIEKPLNKQGGSFK